VIVSERSKQRADQIADQTVDHTPSLLRVNEASIDWTSLGDRALERGWRNLNEAHALGRAEAERLRDVP
jgi:hypothetical protein